jgi:hypothetical protein
LDAGANVDCSATTQAEIDGFATADGTDAGACCENIAGKCTGNTVSAEDVDCSATNHPNIDGFATAVGTDAAACCQDCYASQDDIPGDELAMLQAVSTACATEIAACGFETMMQPEVCGFTATACTETLDACGAHGDDGDGCAAAVDCEVATMTVGEQTMEQCVPSAGEARGVFDCVMGEYVALMEAEMAEAEAAEAAAVLANACGTNEHVQDNECVPCPLGTTRPAGDDKRYTNTDCSTTVCLANEYVLAHTCQTCPTGFTNDADDQATGPDTECSPPDVAGRCQGNTDSDQDVTCPPDTKIPRPDPMTVVGTDVAACCVDKPTAAPEVTHKWQAGAYTRCSPSCIASTKTRAVTCQKTTLYPSTGSIVRVAASEEGLCAGTKPAESAPCPVIPAGGSCDDELDDTSHDQCVVVGEQAAECQGKVQLSSAATLPISIEALAPGAIPDTAGLSAEAAVAAVDASPLAAAVKTPLAAGLGVDAAAVTITGISAGSIAFDFIVAVARAAAAATKTAASTATPAVTIPAEASASGEEQTAAAAVAPLKSYAYVKHPVTCPAACSNKCGAQAVTAADVYTCAEDDAPVPLAVCAPALGAAPSTTTECCEAADPSTCEESSRSATSCAEDFYVTDVLACAACAAGKTNPLVSVSVSATEQILVGDSKLDGETTCDATLCGADEHVSSNACADCAAGTTNAEGDDASGADTACDATLCDADEHVSSNACAACTEGTTNDAGDDASGADTTCEAEGQIVLINDKTSIAPAAAAPLAALVLALLCVA